ncbi:hypothetical protein LTR16_001170 [Cryomyces antarcticus]|uniref:Amidase domain-containing protein n=1 Tax=Cryomyces antarcticus TaxID=329879 RepID=A0ABR0KU74_9PEZI|nr:hypothetical protein LTR39_001158 [Cryomyces antarcticus]KAK5130951.1 hypothetical protein LTR16_001170 [Cryomyces antarcticus]KAK5139607.1 hypothetical protein LTR04_003453 [Oleoguttula sp. CCFEE 6159]
MATKDRMQTTAGSWALLGSIVPRNAHVASQLREAGAVILGHAKMSEWASIRSSVYSSDYSPRRGQVRNPYDLFKRSWNKMYGERSKREFTVAKVDAYNNINSYLAELQGTTMKTVEDIAAYVDTNSGTEGAREGDHAAFAS